MALLDNLAVELSTLANNPFLDLSMNGTASTTSSRAPQINPTPLGPQTAEAEHLVGC